MTPSPASELSQSATVEFFSAMLLAYLAACATWLITKRLAGPKWPEEPIPTLSRPGTNLLDVVMVVAGVLLIGQAFRAGWLIPELPGHWNQLGLTLNLCIPYAPILVCLILRRQSTSTVWVSSTALGWKLGVGAGAALISVVVYTVMRGELSQLRPIARDVVVADSLSLALPVFLEGVAVAFLVVRLRSAFGSGFAVAVPSLLFAVAHIPGGIESGRPVAELAMFFVFNAAVVAAIMLTVMRSQDVIWIALPHYGLDVASGAFG